MVTKLLPVPDRLSDPEGRPLFGAYRGVIPDGSLTGLAMDYDRRGLRRLAAEKCWQFVGLCTPEWIASLAIVRMGYAGLTFFSLFDREDGEFLVDQTSLAPPLLAARIDEKPGDGAKASFRIPGVHASVLKPPGLGRYEIRLRWTGGPEVFDLAAQLKAADHPQGGPDGLTAICPVTGNGSVNLTVKQVALPASGRMVLGERTFEFGPGAFGLLDYSHGFLDRTTAWMWACAGGKLKRGRVAGLNLVAGFNDSLENAVWLGQDLIPVGPVVFHRDSSGPTAPWTIRDADGKLDLTFTPEGVRSEQRDVGPLSSHYLQPVGTFSGKLTDRRGREVWLTDLPGVCEEHFSRW